MLEIGQPRQIAALASPMRLAIVDALEGAGPCSVAELAAVIGARPDGLYYHLRILKRCGLIVMDESVSPAGREQVVVDVPGRPIQLKYVPRRRSNVASVTRVVAVILRASLRNFREAFSSAPVVAGPRRELWAGHRIARLTPEHLEMLNRLLHRLIELLGEEREERANSRLYSFTFVLSPLGRSPSRRSPAGSPS